MAQAVLDAEHPLQAYLAQAGEIPQDDSLCVPGGCASFLVCGYPSRLPPQDLGEWDWLPSWLTLPSSLRTNVSDAEHTAFAERFKYSVISSSLLSATLPPPHPVSPPSVPAMPLENRESGLAEETLYKLSYSFSALFFFTGFYLSSITLLGYTFYMTRSHSRNSRKTTPQSLSTLRDLIDANDVWDTTVGEALRFIESSESNRSLISLPTSSQSPTLTPLRIALHTSLQTTESQCDNIRPLLSALSSPSSLPQISEMYAPASPGPFTTGRLPPTSPSPLSNIHPRPLSLPTRTPKSARFSTLPSSPSPMSKEDKRSTWSYFSLARAGSPSRPRVLPLLLNTASASEPVTPAVPLDVEEQEQEHDDREEDLDLDLDMPQRGSFGFDVLDMKRKRKIKGLSLFSSASASSSPLKRQSFRHSTISPPSIFPSPSSTTGTRYTSIKPISARSRKHSNASLHHHHPHLHTQHHHYHPLSTQAIRASLGRTLGTKRYTCSFLLALRFGAGADEYEGEGEGGERREAEGEGERKRRKRMSLSEMGFDLAEFASSTSVSASASVTEEEPIPFQYPPAHININATTTTTQQDEEEERYWEDVQSVISLLTSTLVDASSRLNEALKGARDEEMRRVMRESTSSSSSTSPTSFGVGEESMDEGGAGLGLGSGLGLGLALNAMTTRPNVHGTFTELGPLDRTNADGYAPTPSRISRFATHVDAISVALVDARRDLERCVGVLREGEVISQHPALRAYEDRRREVDLERFQYQHQRQQQQQQQQLDSPRSQHPALQAYEDRRRELGLERQHQQPQQQQQLPLHPALQAYEDLRRELGLALRECERGREKLLDIISPPPPHREDAEDEDEEDDDVPALGPDMGSDESEGRTSSERDSVLSALASASGAVVAVTTGNEDEDDATRHLLMQTTAEYLPPVGAEQVFESIPPPSLLVPHHPVDSGSTTTEVGVYNKERSKMTREERIRVAKERRKSVGANTATMFLGALDDDADAVGRGQRERWGPGGEVVQELKDVIWEVGKRRRATATGLPAFEPSRPLPPVPASLPSPEPAPTTSITDDTDDAAESELEYLKQ